MTHSQTYLKQLFKDFKKRLSEVNMTQAEVANDFKVTRSHLNKVLNGRTDASLSLIEQIENFTYGNDKIFIKKDNYTMDITNFLQPYAEEIIKAAASLDTEYGYKIFMYLFTKLYFPDNEENPDSFSIEELCNFFKCKEDNLIPSLDELVEKGYLIQEFDKNGKIENFGFDINPTKGNKDE